MKYLKNKGLKFGIYRDRREGHGHEAADAMQYAEWGVDYVKNDGYGPNFNVSSQELYGRFRDAVNRTGHAMALNVKFDLEPDGFAAGPSLANSWRTGRDMRPVWADVVRQADIASAAAHLPRPGAFNDLDALEVGVPGKRFTCPFKGATHSTCVHDCVSHSDLLPAPLKQCTP